MIVRKLLLLRRLCLHHPFLLRGRCDFPPSSITFESSDSRIIVRPPTFVRCSFPLLSQAWTVHLLMPPSRRAASSTESKTSICKASKLETSQLSLDEAETLSYFLVHA